MLSPTDLIPLPYTPDLTPAGIAYACQAFPYREFRNTTEIFHLLRQTVAQQAAEIAFRRYLTAQEVPHNLSLESLFSRPERVIAVIGGHCCSLYSSTILNREKVHKVLHNPANLLSSPALIPSADLFQEIYRDTDLLVFSFVTGLVTPTLAEINLAAEAGEPVHMVYPLKSARAQPSCWTSLGRITLKSESNSSLQAKLAGYNSDHQYVEEEVELPPLCRVQVKEDFYALTYIQVNEMPRGRLGVHYPALEKTLVIHSYQWGNIWVYGLNIILAGWMERGEFRRNARPCQPARYITSTKGSGNYLTMPVGELRPLQNLFDRASNWSRDTA